MIGGNALTGQAAERVDVVEVGPINNTIHKVNEEILIEDKPRLMEIYYRIAELLLVEKP